MNKIGKLIDYKYRVITLDGEVLYAGGAITGGTIKKDNSLLKLKQDALKLTEQIDIISIEVKRHAKELNNILTEEKEKNELVRNQMTDIIDLTEKINRKNISLMDLKKNFNSKQQELDSTNNVKNNDIDKEINELLEDYYKKTSEKDILMQKNKNIKNELDNIILKINDFEEKNKKINADYNKNQNNLKDIEIKLGKMDVKLDNYLNILNENYNMTYNHAVEVSDPNMDINDAKDKVNNLKQLIKQLGDVNIGSIQEYERVNTRYTFLVNQQEDLNSSTNELLNIINDMDKIMITKFKESFNMIANNFSDVFKTLFKGGIGKLILTDPDNLLETGIDIIAEPPGKKLNSIVLLSGGEKTLTAIALLFAILKTKPVPFVILDEVEAALDDANVDTFGKYLEKQKENSQFIIITHKKKTMEYADTLYGITMQESGVSKLVSVKLED
jgi:chromosome segregation protein